MYSGPTAAHLVQKILLSQVAEIARDRLFDGLRQLMIRLGSVLKMLGRISDHDFYLTSQIRPFVERRYF